jgi:transposase
VAFAGIDASVSQSGEFEGSHMHMSKRGSPYLRRALYTREFSNILYYKSRSIVFRLGRPRRFGGFCFEA